MKHRCPRSGLTVIALIFLGATVTRAANMSPMTLSGFNWDVVIENTAAGPPYSAYASELNPGENLSFYQSGLPGKTFGLPVSGGFTSAVGDGTTFQFQPYTGNSALVLSSDTGLTSGTLTLATPAIYGRIAILANSASATASSAGALTLNFNDGTTFTTTYNAPDWFNNSGFALQGTERISLTTGATSGATTNPRFYQTSLDLNGLLGSNNKPIASITFGKASSANSTGIYAISGEVAPPTPASIVTHPVSTNVIELAPASFRAVVGGTPIPTVQWYKNGGAISGATNTTYIIAAAALADNGAAFRLVASNVVNSISYVVTSSVANLTVIADTNIPVLLGAQSQGLGQVVASFSERIKPVTATHKANYSIIGTNGSLVISNAVLDLSQSNVVLTVSPMTDQVAYTLTVNNLADQSVAGNVIAANSQATFVASIYTSLSIGNPNPAGGQSPGGNGWNISGGGVDFGGISDQGQFNYVQSSGDFDVMVRLGSLSLADAWSEAGMLVREDLSAGARSASVMATPSVSGCYFQSRTVTNGATTLSGSFPVNYPNTWLRLKRSGNDFTGFAGFDGLNWSQLGTANISMPASVYFGFAVSSHNTNQLSTAAFRDFASVTTVGTNAPPAIEPLGQCSRRTSLVISEIMYHPATNGLEFVELFNTRGEPQDMSGFQLDGSIQYTIPPGTVLPGGGFLVVAGSPTNLQTAYGLTGVLGPFTNNLPNSHGTVRLLNQAGAVFLEVNYDSVPPWPVSPDGGGHSLVLAHSSYGEDNVLAWAASDSIGGSPGNIDPFTPNPVRNVFINEFLAHTDLPDVDYIELYNHSSQPVDISGCILTDDPATNKFVVPAGTMIPARGFIYYTETTMGFGLNAAGETIYFRNAAQTRVVDAVRFEAQQNGVAMGRSPDGGDQFYRLAAKTPGTNNGAILVSDVVINELMYHPISEDDNDQYIELYNRGTNSVDLGGWTFDDAVNFTFPSNGVIAPGAYVVVAKLAAHLMTNYPNLNPGNTYGDFSGKLSGNGERLTLRRPDPHATTNASGFLVTNLIYIAVDEVTYGTGGRWGQWSDGGGSSLELIDSHSNHRLPSNWADSDETHKAPWKTFSTTGTIDNGNVAADQLQVLIQGAGECLIDNVQVLTPTGINLITNSTFETDATGWTAEGTESISSLETTEGYGSSKSYHVRAVDRADNEINRVRTPLTAALSSGTTNVTIQAAVRWLKGQPEALFRLRGNWLECEAEMALPVSPGTPGARNSRFVTNAPPAFTAVQHSPILPVANQSIVVSARVHDPDGLASVILKYRVDPSLTYSNVAMLDNGTGGDTVARDGVYSATIPGQANGTTVAFYVQAADNFSPPATNSFPNDAPARECLVRVGEFQPTGNFPVYRIWMTAATLNTWNTRAKLNNTPLDVTFVLGNQRVIYNTLALYAGSPYISPGYSGATSARCGYSVTTPVDDLFLGEQDLVLDWPGGHGSETTAMQEEMGHWVADRLNLPFSHRYIIRLIVNGVTDTARQAVFEAVMQPAKGFVKEWVPNDTGGQFFKIERAYEFNDTGSLVADPQPRLQNFTTTGGAKKREKYRWNWMFRGAVRNSDYTNIFALVDALNAPAPEPYNSAVPSLVDVEEWMGIFATEHIIVNFDAYGHEIGKNMYAYLPPNGKWRHFMFDLDWLMLPAISHNASYAPATAPLFNSEDPTIATMYSFPPFARAYWRAVQNAVNGPLLPGVCNPVMDAKYKSLVANGVAWCDNQPLTDPTAVKNWFSQRLAGLQSQLATVASPFAINSVVVSNNVALVSGTAPIGAQTIWFNGAAWPVVWTSVTNWTATVVLQPGTNNFNVVGVDPNDKPVTGTNIVSAVYGGTIPTPVGQVVINEIMYNPAVPDSQFVELYNNSTNISFDLSGWDFHGLSYNFPVGSLIGPKSFLVLAANRAAFAGAYGATKPVFHTFNGGLQLDGETLALVRPGTNTTTELTIAKVRYSSALPWPAQANGLGSSLQLIDPRQDNWRAGNWAAGSPSTFSPTVTNTVLTNLPPFAPLWINELQADNLTGITNQAGQRTAWLELYNPSTNTVNLTNLYLANSYTNLTKWAIPSNATIGPGQFKVIFADGQTNLSTTNELHTSFTLSSGAGSLALSRLYNGQPQVLDYVDYATVGANHSYGSYPDGQSFDRQEFFYVTAGGTNNGTSAPLSVVINEWMAGNTHTLQDPLDDNKYDDWFELFNYGTNTVNLAGYYLTDNLTNEFQFLIPPGYTIPPHGFLLVWADKKTPTGSGDLHVNFKLSKSGESIGLYGADGNPVDYVNYGVQTDDVSEGRYPDGASALFFMPTATPRTNNLVPNTAPVLAFISNRVVTLGQTLSFTASATDADQPPQTLTFSLGSGVPGNASIIPGNGFFSWTPTAAPATNSFSVIVADSGIPSLSATQTFAAVVYLPPQLGGFGQVGNQFIFGWQAPPGQTSQVEFKDDLSTTTWTPLGAPITGSGNFITVTNDLNSSTQRFFRLRILP